METLGRYEILGELGRGGCGVVYRALDPGIGRTVAIKTIRIDGSGDSLRERFRREARSAGNLSHPNIVTIHEFNDAGDVMFIAMEYIDGQTLAQRMNGQELPLEFVLATVRSAAGALDFAHASNIVHRDVKPANFLITKHGLLKITDFGIAKMLDSDVSLTNTGMVIGTAQYMSPEQIAAKEVTGRSDQFSLAVIAYEMLTGQRPFQGNSWASMMHSIIASEPPPLSQYRESLGEVVTEVLRKALAKEALDRYSSCKEFSDALERSILGTTVERQAFWAGAARSPLAPELVETLLLTPTQAIRSATAPNPTSMVTAAVTMITPPPTTTREVPPPAMPRRSWAIPIVTGAVIALGLVAWIVLRNGHSQDATQPPAASVAGSPQDVGAPAQAAGTATDSSTSAGSQSPGSEAPASRAVPRASSDSQGRQTNVAGSPVTGSTPRTPAPAASPVVATTVAPAPPAPVAAASNPVVAPPPAAPAPFAAPPPPPAPVARAVEPPPQPPPVATPAPIATATPAPAPVAAPVAAASPAPAPARGPDPAEVAAQRRAAELQASRREIADAVNRYRQAIEARDLDGLKAAWPGLGRNEQNSFQNFFKIARSVKLQLTPVGEPDITPSGATARYRRSMSATDERGALPAQDQTVKITFRKSGDQMLIDAIEALGR